MTNFEKWRDSLTPEMAWLTIRHCGVCPAKSGPDCRYFQSHKCAEAFTAWANAKAEGGMDYEALAKKAAERLDKMTDEPKTEESRRC